VLAVSLVKGVGCVDYCGGCGGVGYEYGLIWKVLKNEE
jgi:hypothetical protein